MSASRRTDERLEGAIAVDLRVVLFVLPAALGAGAWAGVRAFRAGALARGSRDWPRSEGIVTRCEVATRRARGRTFYEPRIEYLYKVDGHHYAGTAIELRGRAKATLARKATDRCRRYPIGARVGVWYDPLDPGFSCLERPRPISARVAGAAVLAALALAFVLYRAFVPL